MATKSPTRVKPVTQQGGQGGQVYIGVGCNLGERLKTLRSAYDALSEHPRCNKIECSSVYETEAMGPSDQPDYLNAVIALETDLPALELLDLMQAIEHEHGRVRTGEHWGPRTLDLDLLLYGEQIISSSRLTVPHPGISDRSFVLMPLFELAPTLVIPEKGSVENLLTQCRQFGIRRLNSLV